MRHSALAALRHEQPYPHSGRTVKAQPLAALHDHLGNALTAEGLAANKILAPDGGEEVADPGEGEEDARVDETGAAANGADELDGGHDAVGGSAHVVGRHPADRVIKGRRGRADSQEEGYLDEEDDEGGRSVGAGGLA